MLETVPAFLSLNFEVAASRKLASLQRDLQTAPSAPALNVAWVSPNNLRINLRHLGRVDPTLAPGILDPLRELVAALPPIRVLLGPLTAFPCVQHARLIIVPAVDPTALVSELAAKIDAQLSELGLPAPSTPFDSHVTLARLSEPADLQQWLCSVAAVSIEARLTEVAVYLHFQRRPGAEHVALDRFALASPPRVSQRPSKAPRQPSQRPSKRPKGEPNATRAEAIPAPPRLPTISAPVVEPSAPAPPPVAAPTPAATGQAQDSKDNRTSSSILPPAVQATLPPDDEWGS